MRIIRVEIVFRDGSSPVVKSPRAQHFHVSKGEDVKIVFNCVEEDGSVRNIADHIFSFGISKDRAGLFPVDGFPRLGTIDDEEAGIASVTINDGDTVDPPSALYYASLHVYDGENDWQPLPQSRFHLDPSSAMPGNPVTNPGPAQLLAGLPVPVGPEDIGKVLTLLDDSPIALGWATVAVPVASDDSPLALGTAAPGTSATYSRSDHVHPLQTTIGDLTSTSSYGTLEVKAGIIGDADGNKFMQFQPAESGSVPLNFWAAQFTNTGSLSKNQVLRIGWNIAEGGGIEVPGRAAIADEWEANYVPGATYVERHIAYLSPTGTLYRPLSWRIDTSTDQIQQLVKGDSVDWKSKTDETCFVMNLDGINSGSFQINTKTPIQHWWNNVIAFSQRNAANDGWVNIIFVDDTDSVVLAFDGGLTKTGGNLNVAGATNTIGHFALSGDKIDLSNPSGNTLVIGGDTLLGGGILNFGLAGVGGYIISNNTQLLLYGADSSTVHQILTNGHYFFGNMGFFGVYPPIAQPSTTGTAGTWTAGTGATVLRDSATDGGIGTTKYNFSDMVLALKSLGFLAL